MDNAELRTRVGAAHLLASYTYFADSGRLDPLVDLFLPDAVFRINDDTNVGREAIAAYFRSAGESFRSVDILPGRHHLSSVYIDPNPQGGATTYACFQFVGIRGADHWGTYRDEVVEVDGAWRFARRRVTVEGFAVDSPLVAAGSRGSGG
ncbi:nuclear transport factor 2 family protein [Frankia sp. AiPs1]|uniref:nuclear transport factor 2 family protein n=1 Tax=Frankia sp. AiPs1 TaxID=573493 RepID=UPI0020443F50|nr:nuclear transport factor 2 family protein [Frankia sp. AiPs1]MCM3920771.1 nuclear transport factor 2 family protein [Frankia sp. AiPs1]